MRDRDLLGLDHGEQLAVSGEYIVTVGRSLGAWRVKIISRRTRFSASASWGQEEKGKVPWARMIEAAVYHHEAKVTEADRPEARRR